MNLSEKQPKGTVLLVDDSPDNLALLHEMLKEHYRIKLANSSDLAWEICTGKDLPDIILLDIMMPGMNGYELCQKLKSLEQTRAIPVIFLSSLTEIGDVLQGFLVGGVDYVTKPFLFEEVFARIQVHLKLRQANLEVQSLLSHTLTASIRVLLDVMAINQPEAIAQATRYRGHIRKLLGCLPFRLEESWAIELAAMLVNLGRISTPDANSYLATSAKLVGQIPRMEIVAQIIGHQLESGRELSVSDSETVFWGSHLLALAMEYDRLVNGRNLPASTAAEAIISHLPQSCPTELAQALLEMATGEEAKN